MFGSGTHYISYTATDGAGNQASCSFTITVTFPCGSNPCFHGATCQLQQPTYVCVCPNGFSGLLCQTDDKAPSVTGCPDPIKVNLQQGNSDVVVTWTEPSTSETVGVSQTKTHQPGYGFTIGVTAVQYTFTDQAGNAAFCTFNVTVSALPMLSQPPMVTVKPTSATVTWQAWNVIMDTGDGPIIAYIVYFTPMEDSNWVSAGNITDTTQATYSFLVENLEPGTEYSFSVAAVRDGLGGEGPRSPSTRIHTLIPTTPRSTTPGQTTGESNGTNQDVVVVVVVVMVILLLIVMVILTYILIKRHRGSKPMDVSTNDLHGKFESSNNLTMINSVENPMIAMDTVTQNGNNTPEPQQRPTSSASQMSALEGTHQFSGLPFKPSGDIGEREARPLPIPLKDFVEYVHTCIRTGKLRDEWASLPGTDAMYACDVSQRPNNKVKNRYRNIPAYDHCRVVLEKIDDDPDSDYINASYIKGYLKDKAYIATQGPNPATVQDFWRMVWQENVAVIVISANLVEDGKSKCVKYWPDKGEPETFGNMYIELEDEQKKGEYVVRTMRVANMIKQEAPRKIVQYHYIQWPDKDVPKDVTPVLRFIKEFSDASPKDSGPFLVHCSAGVGRTGAVTAIHASLKRALSEKSVDVYNFVSDMRDHRNNTVQTPAQYVFIHLALLEALFATDTKIPESDFKKKLSGLKKKNKMADEFNRLEIITPVPAPERCRHSLAALNENKNRFSSTIFTEAVRPYLMTPRDDGIEYNYINASFIEGFKARDVFVVTQAPLPNTVIDLWRLIYDYELTSMVMLNPNNPKDEECPQFWPSSGSKDYGPFTVTNVLSSRHTGYIVSYLQLTHRRQQRQRNFRHYQFTDWPEEEETPKSPNSLLRLILAVEKDKEDEKQSPILVQCIDGLGRTGVFCTLKNSLDRLRMESNVDIMQTIKVLRLNRPNMVATLALYRFCYEAMGAYIDDPDKFAEEDKGPEAIYENMPGDQAAETMSKEENIYQNLGSSDA
ncbi:receptor-type tyrosine-protein phosphatase alpha-like [Asterias rubens]|uniref:receptor-type tyrosine-protein phosphatase alpha-like n=1 Tax=Asterias rubens TaxID=7604 RepID=UPI001455C910|nr:receptor-type tyrosine-protein phosphatase alpha-like [Asterias rubens]